MAWLAKKGNCQTLDCCHVCEWREPGFHCSVFHIGGGLCRRVLVWRSRRDSCVGAARKQACVEAVDGCSHFVGLRRTQATPPSAPRKLEKGGCWPSLLYCACFPHAVRVGRFAMASGMFFGTPFPEAHDTKHSGTRHHPNGGCFILYDGK